VYCDNCGTTIEESAKFCRACGKATPLSEATTKRFDEQPELQTPTSPVASSLTGPAYLSPFELPAAQQTNDLRQKKQKRNLIILVSMLAVMIFALGGLLLFLNFSSGSTGGLPPPVSEAPTAPGSGSLPPPVVGAPPVPPTPPAPPGISGPSTIDQSLVYPGARQTMSVV
jgi:zinc-ribbon domain